MGQGNMSPQSIYNYTIEDLVDSEGDKTSVSELRRMMIRVFKELKENIQKQINKSQENMDKKLRRHRNN
jgi:hypothetical protein